MTSGRPVQRRNPACSMAARIARPPAMKSERQPGPLAAKGDESFATIEEAAGPIDLESHQFAEL